MDKDQIIAELFQITDELIKAYMEEDPFDITLIIYRGLEMIGGPSGNDPIAVSSKNTFLLTGTLLRNFYQLLSPYKPDVPPELFRASLINFYLEIMGKAKIIDKAIPADFIGDSVPEIIKSDPVTYEIFNYGAEIFALAHAINFWLHPKEDKKITPDPSKDLSLPITDRVNKYCCVRCSQFISFPLFRDGGTIKVYNSSGILPLCWAEIWHAIDHKIKAGVCPYCWDVFIYPSNNYQKAHCGRDECKRAHIIKQHGGEEGYRKWESSRKKPVDGEKRKRGRPKKKEGK